MRLAFLLLLLASVVLFAWQLRIFGPAVEPGREPQRLALQVNAESIRVLSREQLASLQGTAGGLSSGGGAGSACIELGDFDDASLARIRARLDALALGDRLQARRVELRGWYMVHGPQAASRAEAERVAQELRGRGIRDLVVMGPNSSLSNAILLGSFRDRELAQRHQADLTRRGLQGIQVTERAAGGEATRFEIRDIDATLARSLAEIQKDFPQSQLGACGN